MVEVAFTGPPALPVWNVALRRLIGVRKKLKDLDEKHKITKRNKKFNSYHKRGNIDTSTGEVQVWGMGAVEF